ncbi:MAG: acyltransferase family protein [Desulfocapsaceae bacterium]
MIHPISQQLRYRPDVDGLRALAVLSVFMFHLQPNLLPGGFLGVDIFFVISGYLITGIITRENHLGTFSLTNFYARRVKRIFPALFVVLALASVIATFLLTPETYVNYMQSARYASAQLSNFFFAQKVGYFEEGFSGQPLLHTWSLGVEEQFYLVWPLLIYLVFGSCRSPRINRVINYPLYSHNSKASHGDPLSTDFTHAERSTRAVNAIMGGVLVLLFISSYVLCLFITEINANTAFYMFYTRAFEFSVGGGLALGLVSQPKSKAAHMFISASGFALIVTSFLVVRQEFVGGSFLRYGTLLACLGTWMIIFSGTSSSFVNRALAHRLPASIGRISYSLYLYHWPLIIFWKLYSGDDSLGLASCLTIVTIAFGLSILSYRYVEQPARKMTLPDRWVLSLAMAIIIVFAVSFHYLEEADTAPWRVTRYTNAEDTSLNYSTDCPKRSENGLMVVDCSTTQDAPRRTIALVGDSHSGHYFPALSEWARQNNYTLKFLGVPGCPMLLGDIKIKSLMADEHAMQCEKALPIFKTAIVEDHDVEMVVIAQRFDLFHDGISFEGENRRILFLDNAGKPIVDHTDYYQQQLQETLQNLRDSGKRVLLAGQVPLFRQVNECDWQPRLMKNVDWQQVCSYDMEFVATWQQQSRSFIRELAIDEHVDYFDPFPYFDEPLENGFNLYSNVDHLNNQGSLFIAPFVSEALGKARSDSADQN